MMQVRSQFINRISCPHCGKAAPPSSWPVNGDSIPFYIEDENQGFSIAVICPACDSGFFVVWDEDPGPVMEFGKDGIRASIYGSHETPADSQLVLVCEEMLRNYLQYRPEGTLMDAIDQAKRTTGGSYVEHELEHALSVAWRRIHNPP